MATELRKKQRQQKRSPRVIAPFACFGLNNELVSLSNSSGPSATDASSSPKRNVIRTFVLDRLPSRVSWFPLYDEVLTELDKLSGHERSGDLLHLSRLLRTKVEMAISQCVGERGEELEEYFTLDKEWCKHAQDVLKGWRALEAVFLEKKTELRELTVSL